ncbi:response regulator transcription factor [Sporosalibacterium faouarense]|uniref:response regulator transcription factor n=1 Tax=Sporosalibacterium faouarense TaxID=516123 RepID=UPI00141C8D85|nr:response regulator transcription factor [Sporosalibacterium faouarense]MTI46671.1 response regulator transcription factor [Bacillota bacterium]
MSVKILIVEDEKNLSDGVTIFLKHNGFDVHQSYNGQAAIKSFECFKPDIVLLDTLLPDIRGNRLCEKFKKESNVGIIFLTALSDKTNILEAFDCGSDDYITKPFDIEILLSRINALIKRVKPQDKRFLLDKAKINNLEFDMHKRDLIYDGKYANLTPIEFRILYYLAEQKDYCTKQEILVLLYGVNVCDVESRTISVHISNIRKKMKKINLNQIVIISKYNKGYRVAKN